MRRLSRLLAFGAPLLCAVGVALGAYASHAGILPAARERLGLAALFAFGHGLGLMALSYRSTRWLLFARSMLMAGVLAFSGGLAVAVFAGVPAVTAPFGGILLIAGWLVAAAGAGRDLQK